MHIMYDIGVMADKNERQSAILELVESGPVRTQAQLIKGLKASGIAVDQSTLSRDLIELSVRKTNGSYQVDRSDSNENGGIDLSGAVESFTTCGPHMIVIRTGVGQAQAVAVRIDESGESAITGSIAGDDTVFVATKTRRCQVVALRRLATWFGDKHEH